MATKQEEIIEILKNHFPDAEIRLEDMVGDQNHYSLEIASAAFKDKALVYQHKMVNEALKELLKSQLHAIQIKTKAIN